jgi:hypothetical protein
MRERLKAGGLSRKGSDEEGGVKGRKSVSLIEQIKLQRQVRNKSLTLKSQLPMKHTQLSSRKPAGGISPVQIQFHSLLIFRNQYSSNN